MAPERSAHDIRAPLPLQLASALTTDWRRTHPAPARTDGRLRHERPKALQDQALFTRPLLVILQREDGVQTRQPASRVGASKRSDASDRKASSRFTRGATVAESGRAVPGWSIGAGVRADLGGSVAGFLRAEARFPRHAMSMPTRPLGANVARATGVTRIGRPARSPAHLVPRHIATTCRSARCPRRPPRSTGGRLSRRAAFPSISRRIRE